MKLQTQPLFQPEKREPFTELRKGWRSRFQSNRFPAEYTYEKRKTVQKYVHADDENGKGRTAKREPVKESEIEKVE